MSRPSTIRRCLSGLAVAALLLGLAAQPSTAAVAATNQPGTADETPPPLRADVDPAERDRLLGSQWRSSTDLAWTTAGDSSGLHILVATARTGYAWQTIASLSEPGFDVDQWIGTPASPDPAGG